MNLRDVWMSVVEMVLTAEGYLVLGSWELYVVGDVIPDRFGFGLVYRIQGEAKAKDARRQMELIGKMTGADLMEPMSPPYFYKTVMVAN